jgi:hypothetical protein
MSFVSDDRVLNASCVYGSLECGPSRRAIFANCQSRASSGKTPRSLNQPDSRAAIRFGGTDKSVRVIAPFRGRDGRQTFREAKAPLATACAAAAGIFDMQAFKDCPPTPRAWSSANDNLSLTGSVSFNEAKMTWPTICSWFTFLTLELLAIAQDEELRSTAVRVATGSELHDLET